MDSNFRFRAKGTTDLSFRYIALLPKRLVMNEVMLGPTWNRDLCRGDRKAFLTLTASP